MEKKQERVLAYNLAKEITEDELTKVSGGFEIPMGKFGTFKTFATGSSGTIPALDVGMD